LDPAQAAMAGVLTPGDLSAAGLSGPVLAFLWEFGRAEPSIPTAALGATQIGEEADSATSAVSPSAAAGDGEEVAVEAATADPAVSADS